MSFNWKGLLGVGSGSSASANATTNGSLTKDGWTLADAQSWASHADDPLDLPNMLGMENFGNTCYMNSVMQALYFCDPFRESLLAYDLSAKTPKAESTPLPTSTNDDSAGQQHTDLQQLRTPTKSTNGPVATAEHDSDSLFYALRTLFQRMASASVQISAGAHADAPATSPGQPSSILGSGLSRKASSRPGTANSKQSASGLSTGLSGAQGQGGSSQAVSAKPGSNSCSNIVVADTDVKAFLSLLKKSNILFDSTAHQDAHELLNFVLNRIGEDIVEEAKADGRITDRRDEVGVHGVGSDGKTLVHRLFEGILTNETRCLTCESVTSRDESFLDLSLDIERNCSVTACLRQFSMSEMLSARNKFFCDTCSGLQEAEKRMKIKKLPNVLALHLKRFKYEDSVQRFVKLAYRVVFPMQLRLFNTSDDAEDPDKLYELYGIIVHIGIGPHHGHYIAIIKVGQRWFVFDDETISVIDEADITRYFGDTPGSGSAYVLFYQAVDLDMQGLGLPDVKAIREEKARLRRETNLRRQFNARTQQQHLQRTASNGGMFPLSPPNSQTGENLPFDPPSRTGTPAEGRSGGLFGRRQNSVSQQVTGASSVPMTSVSSSESQSDGKGSWLSSLRSRKPSANAYPMLPQAQPSAANATTTTSSASSPVVLPKMLMTGSPDDDEARSISAGSSSHHRQHDEGVKGLLSPSDDHQKAHAAQGSTSRQRSPIRESGGDANANGKVTMSEDTSIPPSVSPSKTLPYAQGATFTPADRPLSKKEQDKIAKQARRNTSLSLSGASPLKGIPPPAGSGAGEPTQNPLPISISAALLDSTIPAAPKSPAPNAETIPVSNSMNSWRRVTGPRRPSTADPSMEPGSTATRRRSTLSRTFGFGRKEKNGAGEK